jgi:nitroreductase
MIDPDPAFKVHVFEGHQSMFRFLTREILAPGQLDGLFKERRSIRLFKRGKIDRALLAEIVSYGVHAPTPAYALRIIAVDDTTLIAAIDQAIAAK